MHTRRCVTHRVRVVDVFAHELDLRSLGSVRSIRRSLDGLRTTRQYRSNSTFTTTSTVSNRAAAWSAKPSAMSS